MTFAATVTSPTASARPSLRRIRRRLGGVELAVGLGVLADLLEAGLPLVRALGILGETARGTWQDLAPVLSTQVREGRSLSAGLEAEVPELPRVVLGLIKAGERGGHLEAAVRRAADHAESRAAYRAQLRAAFAYPAVVAVAGSGALVVLVGVVLPRFAALLRESGQDLPPLTEVVLAIGAGFWTWGIAGLLALVAGGAAIRWAMLRPDGRRRVDRLLLQLPFVGALRHAGATARLASATASMLQTGVVLRTALRIAAEGLGDAEIEARVAIARAKCDAGATLAQGLAAARAVTPTAHRLIGAGEEGAEMPRMLLFVARLESARAERLTRTALRLAEPLMILAFAGVVSVVAIALLQALYAIRPA